MTFCDGGEGDGAGMIGREQPVRLEQLGDDDLQPPDQSVQGVGAGCEAGHVVAAGDPNRGFGVPGALDCVDSFRHGMILHIGPPNIVPPPSGAQERSAVGGTPTPRRRSGAGPGVVWICTSVDTVDAGAGDEDLDRDEALVGVVVQDHARSLLLARMHRRAGQDDR